MTCEKCGHKEVIYYERDLKVILKRCPVCDDIPIMSKEMSLEVIKKECKYVDNLLISKLKEFNKSSLFFGLLAYREILIGKFLNNSPLIKLTDLLSSVLLLKKAMIYYNDLGNKQATKENIEELFSYSNYFVDIKEKQFLIEEEFGYFTAEEDFDFINIESGKLDSKLDFINDEDWLTVIESLDQNYIKTSEAAQEYLEKHKEEYGKSTHNQDSRISTPEEYIHLLYPTFQSFKYGLTKNRLFAETFEFEYMENKEILIQSFSKLIEYSDIICGKLLILSIENFKRYLNDRFGELNQEKLYKNLIFKHNNQTVAPLFIELDDFYINIDGYSIKYSSCIITSLTFLDIIKLFYYPIYYKDIYKLETDRLSDYFEKNIVPEEFYKKGFNVRVDIKKKDALQIDSIAWDNDFLYVIETKLWDVSWFFEHRRIHNQRERDLKGIVDGYKYSNNKEEKIPSLTSKVNYVKENLTEIFSNYVETQMFPDHDSSWNNIDKNIIGLIITKSYPPVKWYKGIKMIGFGEIKDL